MTRVTLDLQIASEDDDHPPPQLIQQWITSAIEGRYNEDVELTVRIVDIKEITQLNNDFRQKNQPTNVLSFPAEIPDHIDLPLLGDLVICSAVVADEALKQQKPLENHWAHMVIHGTLHLLGYDHIDDHEAQVMESLETNILANFNIPNPYTFTEIAATEASISESKTM